MRYSSITKYLIAGTFMVPSLAFAQNQDTHNTTEDSLLCIDKNLQGNWFLDSAQGIEKRPVQLRINQDQLYLKAGCNDISGTVKASPNQKVKFQTSIWTAMGCSDNYESEFADIFFAADHYQRNDDFLTIVNASNSLTFRMVDNAAYLEGAWKVASLNIDNGVTSSVDQPRQTMRFESGKIGGTDGCNSYSGSFTLSGDKIGFSNLRGTRMFCEGVRGRWSNAFSDVLSNADKVFISPGAVEMRNAEGELLVTLVRE